MAVRTASVDIINITEENGPKKRLAPVSSVKTESVEE